MHVMYMYMYMYIIVLSDLYSLLKILEMYMDAIATYRVFENCTYIAYNVYARVYVI